MNNFLESIKKVFGGATKAFKRYPIVLINALFLTVISIIQVSLDLEFYSNERFLFTCLQLAAVLGTVVPLAGFALIERKEKNNIKFVVANVLGVLVTIITFVLLYYFSVVSEYLKYQDIFYKKLSNISEVRVFIITFVSLLLFTLFISEPEKEGSYARSFFMVHKAFTIALIYGLVILIGVSSVIAVFQNLLLDVFDSNIYKYIGIISAFIGFTVFVGYFPNPKDEDVEKQKEIAEKQSKFIQVLFEYILAPVMLALTIVLILWSLKKIIVGIGDDFNEISAIAFSYTYVGIWLHLMLTNYKTGLANFYKKVYPIAALFILIFEAVALVNNVILLGLRTIEYNFILIWIFAFMSAIALIAKKDKSHNFIVLTGIVLLLISVSPYINYKSLPARCQINRLEKILLEKDMLQDNKIVHSKVELDKDTKELIKESVYYLSNLEYEKLPVWFDKKLYDSKVFEKTFGFPDYYYNDKTYRVYITKNASNKDDLIEIKDYSYLLNIISYSFIQNGKEATFKGERGEYKIYWNQKETTDSPSLKITLNEKTIYENSLEEFINIIENKYFKNDEDESYTIPIEDMSYEIKTEGLNLKVIFNEISIKENIKNNTKTYNFEMKLLLINEVM